MSRLARATKTSQWRKPQSTWRLSYHTDYPPLKALNYKERMVKVRTLNTALQAHPAYRKAYSTQAEAETAAQVIAADLDLKPDVGEYFAI